MRDIIVVGVDGSGTAQKAAAAARDLAAALNAGLHVVTAFDSDRAAVYGDGQDPVIVPEAEVAENIARSEAESLGYQNVTYSAARGRPADALLKEAARMDARIIVVGNRRMHGIGRVLGSVANSVAHNAPCDVYIANTYDTD